MRDPRDLPHLIRLLDDESEVVRDSVLRELSAYGPYLEIELSRFNIKTDAAKRHQIRNLLGQHSRQWLELHWPEWRALPNDKDRLEHALGLLAQFQYGQAYPTTVTPLLDRLATTFRRQATIIDPLTLAVFLFKTSGLSGAEKDYYNPYHSNLVYVIEEKHGNPISLTCVYILVGRRLGLDIEGVNFPGHFLARARNAGWTYVVDAFNGGRFLERNDLLAIDRGPAANVGELLDSECPADMIVARILRNLIQSYRQEDQPENASFFQRLLATSDEEENGEEEN